eukprot:sb/3474171/
MGAHSFSICSLLGLNMAALTLLLFATFALASSESEPVTSHEEPVTSASPEFVTSNVEYTPLFHLATGPQGGKVTKNAMSRNGKQPIRTRYLGHNSLFRSRDWLSANQNSLFKSRDWLSANHNSLFRSCDWLSANQGPLYIS